MDQEIQLNPKKLDKLITAKKMAIVPVVSTVISSLTYSHVKDYVSPEIYVGVITSVLLGLVNILKVKFGLKL